MVRTDREQVRKAEQCPRKRHEKQSAQYPGSKQEALVPLPVIPGRCGNVSGDLGEFGHLICHEAQLPSEYCEGTEHRSLGECAPADPHQIRGDRQTVPGG